MKLQPTMKARVNLAAAAAFLKENDDYLILCHLNPDGDTLGSAFALCGALQLLGKTVEIACAEKASARFDFLTEALDCSREISDFSRKFGEDRNIEADSEKTVVAVDVADPELLGKYNALYGKRINLCVDHHVSNRLYAERTLLDPKAAACAEIVWELIKELNIEIHGGIAAAIYTGISTDTGCYKYSNTSAKSHLITAELLDYYFDVAGINYLMFEMKTKARLDLEQSAYSSIEYFCNNQCAMITLMRETIENVDIEDANNVSSLPRQIEGVEAGVVIKEKDERDWKISLRTSGKVDAREVCATLGGGGHIRAAGCSLKGDLEMVKAALVREINKQLTGEIE